MSHDVLVVGAGVNGLTVASYLANAGRRVTLLCESDQIGGLCSHHEFFPGFFSPGILYDTSMLRSWVVDDLQLEKHGLEINSLTQTLALGNEQQLIISHDVEETAASIARLSTQDADSYRKMMALFQTVKPAIHSFLNTIPSNIIDPQSQDLVSLLKQAWQLRSLGKKNMLDVMRLAPMAIYDWLDEWFSNDGLKAALALPAVTESYSAPWSAGTNTNLLIRQISTGPSIKGGGVKLIAALERAAISFGVEIKTKVEVDKIIPNEGVRLKNGEVLTSKTIISSYGLKKVFLQTMDNNLLASKFEQRIRNFRTRGLCSQLLLALDKPPALTGGNDVERIIIADDLDAIEKAFDPIKYGQFSPSPCLEIYLPTHSNKQLAPEGQAVMSVLIHYTPYQLVGGWTEQVREQLCETVIGILQKKIPGIKESIVGRQLLTPKDIELRYGVCGGQIYEGEHALDQLLVRPIPECCQYSTPFDGLYLCSGANFPGGGITAAPGALAAKKILADS